MKKFSLKILNLALWVELALSYILPFTITDDFHYQVGFPLPFITVYNKAIGVNPLVSMHLNPLLFLINVLLIYCVIFICVNFYKKIKIKKHGNISLQSHKNGQEI